MFVSGEELSAVAADEAGMKLRVKAEPLGSDAAELAWGVSGGADD